MPVNTASNRRGVRTPFVLAPINFLGDIIEDLENTGVVIKGIDEGLLDFPSKRFDDEIWLCWKQGETEIKFWHEKDIGFSGRKPISVDDKSLV